MPQISLYIDRETLDKIERAARAERQSISRWVSRQIKQSLQTSYTSDLKSLYGSIDDDSFDIPDRGTFSEDVPRNKL
jgi:hypothetical protein